MFDYRGCLAGSFLGYGSACYKIAGVCRVGYDMGVIMCIGSLGCRRYRKRNDITIDMLMCFVTNFCGMSKKLPLAY